MRKLLFFLFTLFLVVTTYAFNWRTEQISLKEQMTYNLRYAALETDTFEFNYVKSPGLAFLLSAVLPGTGEIYAHSYYRGVAFMAVEAFSWAMYFDRKATGQKIEKQYKKFANQHWSLYNWYFNSLSYPDLFGLTRRGFGSHTIWVEYNGLEYPAHEDTLNHYIPTWAQILYNEKDKPYSQQTLRPIRTRDFYENIGKYDQFATGWDDFSLSLVDTTNRAEPVKNSPNREKYLNDRYKSNQAFKTATNFATVIMFNHLISAFHAQIVAKRYRPEKEVSWQVALITDCWYKFPIRGAALTINF